jgi:tetraacyldisaccharide 4'-kinase
LNAQQSDASLRENSALGRFRPITPVHVLRFDESAYRRLVRGETRGLRASAFRVGLRAAALVYGLGAAARNAAFDHGWKRTYHARIPVISVGNLTLGGTGKTPMVEWLARRLRERGLRVVILSRGYGQQGSLNDEGLVLEENLPDVPHLQGSDRAQLARIAIEELESQVAVLDDGFQHRRLARDLDVVLLDAIEPFGYGRLSPRGLLREPVRSLRRADIVVLSRADLIDATGRRDIRAAAERRAGPLRWVEAGHRPRDFVDADGISQPLDRFKSARVAAFCGIGNPDGFRGTLNRVGVDTVRFRTFPDHHAYTTSDVADLTGWLRTSEADLALTTQKDLVKLRTPNLGDVPLCALRIGMELLTGAEIVEDALNAVTSAIHAAD